MSGMFLASLGLFQVAALLTSDVPGGQATHPRCLLGGPEMLWITLCMYVRGDGAKRTRRNGCVDLSMRVKSVSLNVAP